MSGRSLPDVIVVGAGGSGIPLAVRLAETGRRVHLIEAGPVPAIAAGLPEAIQDAGTLRGAHPSSPYARAFDTTLAPCREYSVIRGRYAGGSTAINAAYFARARRSDFDRWSTEAGQEWSYDAVLPSLRRMERDMQYGRGGLHGADGPMLVTRQGIDDGLSAGLVAAAAERGIPFEADKNGEALEGIGPVPQNVDGGVRWSTAHGYLWSRPTLPNLTIIPDTTVSRVVFAGDRVEGAECHSSDGPAFLRAGEVVLSAGAFATPQLLMLSGVGPADVLQRCGVACRADLPGVGAAFEDHPSVAVEFAVPTETVDLAGAILGVGLNTDLEHGPIELLPLRKPVDYLLTGERGPEPSVTLSLRVSAMRPRSRGRITVDTLDPESSPVIHHRYLDDPRDMRTLADGVRLAADLLRRIAPSVCLTPVEPHLADATDPDLERWVRRHLGTSVHACASAPMGRPDDVRSVVDSHGRVKGVAGLRIADTSILPDVPSRGPANTAVLIGEHLAAIISAER
jgi:predicted dehydrogenase (TIGR03970 family)